jgi:predicted nucleic acid-binding protein
MILLDTNLISELVKQVPSPQVAAWFIAQDPREIATTTVTEAELLYGLALLPAGRRKMELEREISALLATLGPRVLPFDRNAAQQFAEIAVRRRAARLPTDHSDGQIAAIARAHKAKLATRNVADFAHCGIVLINPWTTLP